jgi:hypothetical protein|tara:strand:- start:1011 stop:1340 length:330 start_codon:yes stop_codon:yes gene_type:complete
VLSENDTPLTKRTKPMKVKSHNDIITHGQLNQITSIRSRFDLVFNDVDTLFRSLPKSHKHRAVLGDILDKKWDILGWLDDTIKGKIPLGNTSFSAEEINMIDFEGTDPE